MNHVLTTKWAELSYEMKKTLMNSGIFNTDGTLNWDGNEDVITKSLALMDNVSLKSINQFINLNNKMDNEAGTSSVGDGKIELDFALESNVPGFEDSGDAAFLSTTIKSKLSLGDSGNARMKIFVPKGTKCFPILNESRHSTESEIVLPPMSVLKVIERNTKSSGKTYYTCVMIGSAVESLVESGSEDIILEGVSNDDIDNLSEEEKQMLLDEAKRKSRNTRSSKNKEDESDEEYDPSGKWGSSTSREDSEALQKLIKSGKLKVK